ncbi:MAG: tryptophan--tRNA ligase [Deltaproteobacteria bacterium]|nr:tryptophan--tRNA ligase [Deltaproteobacteria bacterium]
MKKGKIVSGMRPTGKMHLGHLHGALLNWKNLQTKYDCFYFIADWHALTSEYAHPDIIRECTYDIIVDWISMGLDPEFSTFFIQSEIKEHAELYLIFSMITPLPWLERNPTYKEQLNELSQKNVYTYGFLGYPVLQAVELTREIARRFNHLYGEVFPVPDVLLTPTSKLLGIDRRKMSKSYGNAIFLTDTDEEIDAKTAQKCLSARIGCVDCKKKMASALKIGLEPIRAKRKELESDMGMVKDIMAEGNKKSRTIARETMGQVREAVKI